MHRDGRVWHRSADHADQEVQERGARERNLRQVNADGPTSGRRQALDRLRELCFGGEIDVTRQANVRGQRLLVDGYIDGDVG
jgi:hypothetical protein